MLHSQQHSETSHETESHDSETESLNIDNEHPDEHSDQPQAYETEEDFKAHEVGLAILLLFICH